jgi:hypothetical protein
MTCVSAKPYDSTCVQSGQEPFFNVMQGSNKTGSRAHRYIRKVNLQELPKPFMGFWGYIFLQTKELVHSVKSQTMD